MTTRFTEDHEFIRTGDNGAEVGISNHAQEQLGDIVFVELPEVGQSFKKGDELAVVESVKAASEIYAPVDLTVTEINETLNDNPGLINEDAMGKGWIARAKVDDEGQLDGLMDEAAYNDHIA